MKRIILALLLITVFGCNCKQNQPPQPPQPKQVFYLKIGLQSSERYVRYTGEGDFNLYHGNLYDGDNAVAYLVSHYSVITEEEYSLFTGLTAKKQIQNIESTLSVEEPTHQENETEPKY